MTVLHIRKVPDPVLRVMCAPVDRFDQVLKRLAVDMLATMYDAKGRGLAAPQIGFAQRMFVMDVTWKEAEPTPFVAINPVITDRADKLASEEEGCLSIPDTPCRVTRPIAISLQWRDVQGVLHADQFDGIAARCIQHEIDHLNGVLCTDHAS